MKELAEFLAWYDQQRSRPGSTVATLPNPKFCDSSGEELISFSTNNYLAISTSQRMKAAAIEGIERYGVGNCESRLLSGNLEIYADLERRLARSKRQAAAMLFPTGYLANVGTLSSLPRVALLARPVGFTPSSCSSYAYFSDAFNHISIKEGIRASGAARASYRHLDLNHLNTLLSRSTATNKIIVTDGVFSQDGDIAPIPDLLQLAERHDAYLYVDDAHGTGVLGSRGGGILEHFGVASDRIVCMGTLSKAYGSIGGFVTAETHIIEALRLTCPAYGFTSTLPPDQVFAVNAALDIVEDEPERRERLWENQRYLLSKMQELPYRVISCATPIVPLLIGNEARADQLATALRVRALHVDSIRFPAVPLGAARLRIQLNAKHTRRQIDHLVGALCEISQLQECCPLV
ncbi:aminotransferase class I/II-fold pyridoxal phosphate-dependent enzyme [Bradyrhizobium sp.]|jgi:glycine C-acetyltransferase|uniref:aminotransferase class I/II-fold pyridoxal phosphate-dependent enzyme n=1 Tax=Bradyrhizobium sp. TaxID=376 RepID=UPI00391CF36E